MAVSVVNTWTGHNSANGSTTTLPEPATMPAAVTVANTAGNWLIAFCSWTLPAGFLGSTAAVSDDAHNYWVPLGAPTGTSSALGYTRCSIWAAPKANAAARVFISPCGLPTPVYPTVVGATVIEVSGLSDYLGTPGTATAYANTATAVSATAPTLGASALMLAVAASDNAAFTGTPAGWTGLTGLSVGSAAPVILNTSPAYALATSATAASWTAASASDLSACVATILVSNPAPAQPNANWPYTQLQAGFGSGALTPPDEIAWTDITDRFLAGTATTLTSGKQYELDQLEAGEVTLRLDNNDGALTPFEPDSPFYPDVVADVPMRLLMTWNGKTYSVFSGFVERWPSAWTQDVWYGISEVTVVDAWSLQNNELTSCLRQEILALFPGWYWPLSDAAGSLTAVNYAPGSTTGLVVVASPLGAGTATQAFGVTTLNGLPGDPGGTAWSQSGLTNTSAELGYCLLAADENFPVLATGVTISGWFAPAASNVTGDEYQCLFSIGNAGAKRKTQPSGYEYGGDFATVMVNNGPMGTVLGGILLSVWETSGVEHDVYNPSTGSSYLTAGWFHVALTLTSTGSSLTWGLYVNGASVGSGTVTGTFPGTFQWVEFCGQADRLITGNFANFSAAHLAVFPYTLPEDRIATMYYAGTPNPQTVAGGTTQTVTGQQFAGEYAHQRIERLLAYGGWTGARSIIHTTYTPLAAISDIQGYATAISSTGVVAAAQGEQVNQAVNGIVLSDGGFIYVDGNGVLCYSTRFRLYDASPEWVLGEDVAAGEIPYEPSARIGYDKSLLYNSTQLTQSTGGGTPVVSTNLPSVAQHGEYVFNWITYQQDVNQVGDEANWISYTRGEVGRRAQSVTVDAGNNPSNWPFVLSICPATPVQVNRRPQLGGAEITVYPLVAQVRKTIDFQAGVAKATIVTDSFPEGTALDLDSVTNGLLDGTHPIPW